MTLMLALLVALATSAYAAPDASRMAAPWIGSSEDISAWLAANMPPPQLMIGILIGLVASEALRLAWRVLQWLAFSIYVFARVAARYGAIAAVIACVLYIL